MIRLYQTFLVSILLLLLAVPLKAQELHNAIETGDLQKVKSILKNSPDLVNFKAQDQTTPLYSAISNGFEKIVTVLLKNGADVNTRGRSTWTPMHIAAIQGFHEIVELLIDHGAELDPRSNLGMTPMYLSVFQGHTNIIKLLADKGSDLNLKFIEDETLLHLASAQGHESVVKLLINHGANMDALKKFNLTPLHFAAIFGHLNVVRLLIDESADMNIQDENGATPMHLAAAAGHDEVVHLLKTKDADEGSRKYPVFEGEYLGMKKPGKTPEVFAPGILLSAHRPHGAIHFSPDGKEIFWSAASLYGSFEKIWFMRQKNGIWLPPEILLHPDHYYSGAPALSPDGKKLFFASDRIFKNHEEKGNIDIWKIEKSKGRWGQPQNIDSPVNTKDIEVPGSVSHSGDLYIQSEFYGKSQQDGDIYISKIEKCKYTNPIPLDETINSEYYDGTPFIAPDESYLLFGSSRPGGYGSVDIYISFKKNDGAWTKAINMGDRINTPTWEQAPSVTPDGKHLFFISRRGKIGKYYWVDAKIIEELKPDELK